MKQKLIQNQPYVVSFTKYQVGAAMLLSNVYRMDAICFLKAGQNKPQQLADIHPRLGTSFGE